MPTTSETIDQREAELLLRFAREYKARTEKGIPAKRLVKLLYLLDIIARQYLGVAISAFRYYSWKFGPYDKAIDLVVRELVGAGLAEQVPEWDYENVTIRLTAKSPDPLFEFAPGEAELIQYVVDSYLTLPMQELMQDVVYQTEPWKQAGPKGKLLPMSVVDNEGRNAIGFELEELLQAKKEIADGNFTNSFV